MLISGSLATRLEVAQVVGPTQQKNLDQVFFGATVTYAHERGTQRTVTIVGVDEADLDRQQVKLVSTWRRISSTARRASPAWRATHPHPVGQGRHLQLEAAHPDCLSVAVLHSPLLRA
jgi:hypothetical protein